jgi:hypothetical protein
VKGLVWKSSQTRHVLVVSGIVGLLALLLVTRSCSVREFKWILDVGGVQTHPEWAPDTDLQHFLGWTNLNPVKDEGPTLSNSVGLR